MLCLNMCLLLAACLHFGNMSNTTQSCLSLHIKCRPCGYTERQSGLTHYVRYCMLSRCIYTPFVCIYAHFFVPNMSKQSNSGIMVWSIFFRSLMCNIWVQRLWTCVVLFEIFLIRKTIAHRCASSFKGFPTTARSLAYTAN